LAKKRRSKSSGSADVFVIDFSKEVDGGGGGTRVPENDYKVKIIKAKKERSKEKDTPGLILSLKITEGKFAGKKMIERLWITPKSLWRVRSLLEALGMEVPKKALKIPAKKLVGKEVGATVIDDDPYNGRIKSKVGDWIDLETLAELDSDEDEDELEDDEDEADIDEDEDSDDEDEDEGEDEDDEDEDEEDLEEMDRKELKAYIKENELDVKVTKKMDEAEIVEAIEEAGNEEEDDDEDDLDLDTL
jgi:hypothetical protein